MHICGMEKMSLVDYDGFVSATIFTGGCNFKCGFCHNSALVIGANSLPSIPESQILSYLEKRKGILDAVCVSGGEPTLQKDLPLFLEKVKKLGYKIKLDTNGTAPDLVKRFFLDGLVDYFAMDIKSDKAGYSDVIGLNSYNLSNVEKSVEFFLSGTAEYEFRTTIIKEFHTEETMYKIAEWINGASKYFLQKFKNSETVINGALNEVELKTAKKFIEILEPSIKTVKLRGYD